MPLDYFSPQYDAIKKANAVTENTKLDSIAQAKAKLLEELQKLEEQEKNERASEAASAHSTIISLLEQFGGFFSAKQRADIAALVGGTAAHVPAKSKGSKASQGTVKPKYQLPHTGETWTGRGRTPKSFAAWEGTAAYKEWKARHPELKFPLYRE